MAVIKQLVITVTKGGLYEQDADVEVYDGGNLVADGLTNSQGTITFILNPKTYHVKVTVDSVVKESDVTVENTPQTQFSFAFD